MRVYPWMFTAWLVGASASTVLRLVTGWPTWRIAESAAIAALSAAAVVLAAPIRRAHPDRGSVLVAQLLLGWLVITAASGLLSRNLSAGIDALLYVPALVLMVYAVSHPKSARSADSETG